MRFMLGPKGRWKFFGAANLKVFIKSVEEEGLATTTVTVNDPFDNNRRIHVYVPDTGRTLENENPFEPYELFCDALVGIMDVYIENQGIDPRSIGVRTDYETFSETENCFGLKRFTITVYAPISIKLPKLHQLIWKYLASHRLRAD